MNQEERERAYFVALLRYGLLQKSIAFPDGYRTSIEQLDYSFATTAPWLEADGVAALLRDLVNDGLISIRGPGPQTLSNSHWERDISDPIIILQTVLTVTAREELGKWISKESVEIQFD